MEAPVHANPSGKFIQTEIVLEMHRIFRFTQSKQHAIEFHSNKPFRSYGSWHYHTFVVNILFKSRSEQVSSIHLTTQHYPPWVDWDWLWKLCALNQAFPVGLLTKLKSFFFFRMKHHLVGIICSLLATKQSKDMHKMVILFTLFT